jgi:hypothetical protein
VIYKTSKKSKKTTLSGLEAQKCDLQKKLTELKSNNMNIQKSEETCARSDDEPMICVIENTPIERIAENEKKKIRFF